MQERWWRRWSGRPHRMEKVRTTYDFTSLLCAAKDGWLSISLCVCIVVIMIMMNMLGMFLSISVSDKSMTPFVLSVPISWGEVEVLKVLVAYCLPRFLALDRFFDTASSTSGPPSSSNGYTQQQQNNGYTQQQQSSPPRQQPFAQFSNQQPYSYN